MCGIAGIWLQSNHEQGSELLQKMTDAIKHRGPDAMGEWNNSKGLWLGHRRLSILDLGDRANQPFHYMERYVVVFNGEIYNFIELRSELVAEGCQFSTNSDTEVLAAAYHLWRRECVHKFDGMFAIALYDRLTNELFCARDRFGEKPFFFTSHKNNFYFASEIKAFWAVGIPQKMKAKNNYAFLALDLVEDAEHGENTFFEGIYCLKAGHSMVVKNGEISTQKQFYYPSIATTFNGTFEEATTRIHELITESVQRRMRADLPVGASLSGGVDSSTIVALMSKERKEISTFSARFDGFSKDEGAYIREVTERFQTVHTNCYPTIEDVQQKLKDFIVQQDEPFQSGSVLAQYKVYETAKANQRVVLLDGQGADELFGGYFKFIKPYFYSIYNSHVTKALLADFQGRQGYSFTPTTHDRFQHRYPYLYRATGYMKQVVKGKSADKGIVDTNRFSATQYFPTFRSLKETLRYNLMHQGLPKLLRFADRNAMAHAVEVRLPFLYHELVDFVLSLPEEFFFHQGWTKSLLRHAMQDELPANIVWRKDKVGFEAPDDQWLKDAKVQEMAQEAKVVLMNKKVITKDYSDSWKTIVLATYLEREA